jgi:hypothetical protein
MNSTYRNFKIFEKLSKFAEIDILWVFTCADHETDVYFGKTKNVSKKKFSKKFSDFFVKILKFFDYFMAHTLSHHLRQRLALSERSELSAYRVFVSGVGLGRLRL